MSNKNWNYIGKIIATITIMVILLNPLILSNLKNSSVFIPSKNENYNDVPLTSNLSKNNFSEILSNKKYSLGNVTINDIAFRELVLGFFAYNDTYPDVWEDYKSNALNITLADIKFMETIEPAIKDNLDENIIDSSIITVKLNESLEVKYNNSQTGFLIYHGRLNPSRLVEIYVNNGTNINTLESETDYTIDNNDFVVFDFEEYFYRNASVYSFSMYIIWEYDLTLDPWAITQSPETQITIREEEQDVIAQFSYHFILSGKRYGQTIGDVDYVADYLDIALTFNHPDGSLINNHILELNGDIVNINNHLNLDNTIDIFLSNLFSANYSSFTLNFTSSYTLKFIQPVENTWAIDRLVEMGNIRERIYFPSLIAGPKHLFLKHVNLYEPTIYYEEVLRSYSLFGREVAFFEVNSTITNKQGINITLPYLILGETCPFTIKYAPSQNLKIVVTNNIKMPLVGAKVEVFYYGQQFGTYMSINKNQPLALVNSDENGVIVVHNVPHGNYTVKVYYSGLLIKEASASTEKEENFVYTKIPHVPIWIIIFGGFNGVILIIGVIFYLKYKNKR